MIQTFTSNLNDSVAKLEKENLGEFAEPSITTLNNILNFSKNLEVKKSKFVTSIEVIKS